MFPVKAGWSCFAIFLTLFFSYGATVRYGLTVDPINPEVAYESVDTSPVGPFSLERPRTVPSSGVVQAPDIECVTTTSEHHEAEYGKEMECREITCSIHFDRLGNLDSNVFNQRNLYSPDGWWVLFEWDDIPRMKGQTDIGYVPIKPVPDLGLFV